MWKLNKGFTLIELIIVIAILGIIALIAIPNLAGIRQRSQVSADKRTAEQIGKAVRIWLTDLDAESLGVKRIIPVSPAVYDDNNELPGLCPTYISSGYTAKSFKNSPGSYYVSSYGGGVNNVNDKIYVGIGRETTPGTAPLGKPGAGAIVEYDGSVAAWAYIEK